MSENQGRQSPPPEAQSGKQQQDPQALPNDQGGAPESGAKQTSEEQKSALASNPTHPLEKYSEEKTSKTM
ncbi:hypothetical protein M501DRAFT_994276, partial [Patellaria atrata CBS 101060]